MFKFKFEKEIKGQNFQGLDLLTKLLTPRSNVSSAGPLIQELDSITPTFFQF